MEIVYGWLNLLTLTMNSQKESNNLGNNNDNIFTYHQPNKNTEDSYTQLQAKAREFSELVDELVPASREQSLAKTKIEEAVMWANAGVARNVKGGE